MDRNENIPADLATGAGTPLALAGAAALIATAVGWAETGQEAINIGSMAGLLALPLAGLPVSGYLHFARGKSKSAMTFLVASMAIFMASALAFVVTSDAMLSHEKGRAVLQRHINDQFNLGCQRITLLPDSAKHRQCVAAHGPGQAPAEPDGVTSIGRWHQNNTIRHTVENYWTHFPEGKEECLLAYHIPGETEVKRLSAEVCNLK